MSFSYEEFLTTKLKTVQKSGFKISDSLLSKTLKPHQEYTVKFLCDIGKGGGFLDTVFTPFMGIGSEVYSAIKMGRKGVGVELKSSYYDVAVGNIKSAVKNKASLFDDMPEM